MPEDLIELAPIPVDRSLPVETLARLQLSFAGVREALAQPHYSHEDDFPGDSVASRVCWRVQDRRSGALLVVWDHRAPEATAAQTASWCVWWQDGQDDYGSGRRIAERLLGAEAGGEFVSGFR